jgi:hypothetical protein
MAIFDLGLTDEFFWSITPVEFDSIMKRYLNAEERTDRRYALGAYVMVTSWSTGKGAKPKFDDFMLHDYRGKKETKADWKQSLQVLREQVGKVK